MSLTKLLLRFSMCLFGLLLSSAGLFAGEKSLLHCFTFTTIEGASQSDWDAFYRATDQLPSKIPAVKHVWYGKLQNPMTVYQPDATAGAAFRGGAGKASGEFTKVQRQYGVCMEMTGPDAIKTYASAPYHKTWMDAYEKVRVEGTTTFNFMGQ